MFSYLLLLSSSIIILLPKGDEINKKIFFTVFFSSFIFANVSLGLISLILISLGLSKFPILVISLLILIITFNIDQNNFLKLSQIINFLRIEINDFLNINRGEKSQKIYLIIVIFILIFILLSSIGPINHPDSADYHVGYPYQYFLRGRFFIDGGLSQGLLGLADYANLAFIQENTVWFIRFSQISNLLLIILYLSKRIKNYLYLIVFLSVPTFIQWSTIGKPLFLGESSLVMIYLIWKSSRNGYNLKLLLVSIINCISFKISSLIIIFPIFIDILFNTFIKLKNKGNFYKIFHHILLSKEFLLSIFAFLALIITRIKITGNFAYPLLTNVFNKNDELVRTFSKFISNYKRDDFFFIKIFIPTNISDLGSSLGLAIFIMTIILLYKNLKGQKNLKNIISFENNINMVCTIQIILLMLFCQGRADYYVAPLILLIYQSEQLINQIKSKSIKFAFHITILFQVLIMSLILFFSTYQNLLSIINYEKSMLDTAYGYNLSTIINDSIPGNFLIKSRNMRLYYPKNYLDKDKMQNCINSSNLSSKANAEDSCLMKYNINQIIASKEDLVNKKLYSCKFINSNIAKRNILKKRNHTFKYCTKKILS